MSLCTFWNFREINKRWENTHLLNKGNAIFNSTLPNKIDVWHQILKSYIKWTVVNKEWKEITQICVFLTKLSYPTEKEQNVSPPPHHHSFRFRVLSRTTAHLFPPLTQQNFEAPDLSCKWQQTLKHPLHFPPSPPPTSYK